MPGISSAETFSVSGVIPGSGMRTEIHERPGVDGADIHQQGIHGSQSTIRIEGFYASDAERQQAFLFFMLLKGSITFVTDNFGRAWFGKLVVDMREELREDLLIQTGGNGVYRLVMNADLYSTF